MKTDLLFLVGQSKNYTSYPKENAREIFINHGAHLPRFIIHMVSHVINWDQLGWYGETCETESPTLNRNQHNDGADASSAEIWYVSTRSWPFPGVLKAKNLVFVLDRAAGFKPDLKKKRAS